MTAELIAGVVGAFCAGGFVWFMLKKPTQPTTNPLELQKIITDRLDRVTEQLDARLRENVKAMNESKSFLNERVTATERAVRSVTSGLGKLQEVAEALERSNQEINSFQQMLRHPKVRGSFGEVLLGNLLGAILPIDRFTLQYTLPGSGDIADAIIQLQDGLCVCVDAKFPLASYEAYTHAADEAAKRQARQQFLRDVKKHVSDISQKYIAPQDKTLDIAFMYIPVEAVYYEAVVRDSEGEDLWDFCLKHRVIPMSPNSFMGYLHTVLVGLKGMKIQQQAQEILRSLGQMRQDFKQFAEDFAMVGKHIGNAKNRFDDSARRLDKFANRLEQVEQDSPNTVAELPVQFPESLDS